MINFPLFILSLVVAISFVIQVESFGFGFYKIAKFIGSRFKINNENKDVEVNNFFINFFTGLVIYGMFLFFTGLVNLTNQNFIIYSTLLISIFNFIYFKRWVSFNNIINYRYSENIPFLSGSIIGLFVILLFSFEPIDSFDGLWYHLPIPKMFLQQGNISYAGETFRYSVHPFLNFFWNLWPLSLPVTTAVAGIFINMIQALTIFIACLWATLMGKKYFQWGNVAQFFGVIILATFSEIVISSYASAYNDILGMVFGLLSFLYIFSISTKDKISYIEFVNAIILISGLFLLKVFFAIPAVVAFLYLIYSSYNKLESIAKNEYDLINYKPFNLKFGKNILYYTLIAVILFVLFILPWFIRSYYYTGLPYHPVGVEGFNDSVYDYIGSKDSANHWESFVWRRFWNNHFIQIHTSIFSLLFGIGFLSILNSKFRSKYSDLWFFSLVGFYLVYFANLVGTMRYQLATAIVIVFIGITFLNKYLLEQGNRTFKYFIILLLIFISFSNIMQKKAKIPFLIQQSDYKDFLTDRSVSNSNVQYFQESAIVPSDLDINEPIYMSGFINRSAYIENPIYEYRIQSDEMSELKTVEQFVSFLNSKNIRFIIDKSDSLNRWCRGLGLEDADKCTYENQYWSVDTRDSDQDVVWYRLK